MPITLNSAVSVPVSFAVATQRRDREGFATQGQDYYRKHEDLTIPAGQTQATFRFQVKQDDESGEGRERILVRLFRPTNAGIKKGWAIGVID